MLNSITWLNKKIKVAVFNYNNVTYLHGFGIYLADDDCLPWGSL